MVEKGSDPGTPTTPTPTQPADSFATRQGACYEEVARDARARNAKGFTPPTTAAAGGEKREMGKREE